MRLQRHINERVSFISSEDINEAIHKNCKPYLKLIKGKNTLWRGLDTDLNMGEKQVRKDRYPYGMTRKEADHINNWLGKNGHNRRDQSVLCTSDRGWAETFGQEYMIFPVGKFSYTWLKAQDANMDDMYTGWSTDHLWAPPEILEKYFTTDKGFDTAYTKMYELWINCKSYYYAWWQVGVWDKRAQIIR